jgi:hypothetical protein
LKRDDGQRCSLVFSAHRSYPAIQVPRGVDQNLAHSEPFLCCQVHKARNITERLPKPLHASVRKALRQAWELDDADKAEKLIRNLARRLEREGNCQQDEARGVYAVVANDDTINTVG